MKSLKTAVAAALAFASAPSMASATMVARDFSAELTGAQEVPAVAAPVGTGAASLTLRQDGPGIWSLAFDLTFDPAFDFAFFAAGETDVGQIAGDAAVTRLHIHAAPRGANGGVVYGLYNPLSDASPAGPSAVNIDISASGTRVFGEWNDGDELAGPGISALAPSLMALAVGEDADLYFNLHTVAWPGGEIRGQIVAGEVAVPLPGALPLLALGLGAMAVARGRRRRA